jgi:hypothetical protein
LPDVIEFPPWLDFLGKLDEEVSKEAGSSAVLDKALKWVQDCVTSHSQCNGVTYKTTPKRLIFIEDGLTSRIRLVENRQNTAYVALSHCWGKWQTGTAVTTKENLTYRKGQMLWNDLPKTFQDAISVTVHLGLEYLWIDSLCIIQNVRFVSQLEIINTEN